MFLAADIGGTRARLLLAQATEQGWRVLRQAELASRDFSGAAELLEHFLAPDEKPQAACLALAGPLHDERIALTNLPWQLSRGALAERLGIAHLQLLNDFAAQAHGLPLLDDSQRITLLPGHAGARGVRALLGPGTGLGMALLAGSDEAPLVLPSQGGHADFAPTDEQDLALFAWLRRRHARVSLELLLSGDGLRRLHGFHAGLDEDLARLPGAAEVDRLAAAGDGAALAARTHFARLLLGCAGNLALTTLAEGGVYLCGGIAPRLIEELRQPAALAAFTDKPPMQALLAGIGLHLVNDPLLGLKGAARVARALLAERSA